jgi:drug/metabolite transporter (DMT)-like permease
MTALCAFFATISAFTSAYVLKNLDISESASLFALSPAVITLLSVFLLGENLAWIQLAGIGLSCVGIFILEGHRHSAKQETHITPLGMDPAHIELPLKKRDSRLVLYTTLFFALICFSSSAVMDRYIVHHLNTDPIFFLIIVQFFILFYFLIIDLFTKKKGAVDSFDIKILSRRSFWAHICFVIAHRVFHMFAVQNMGASLLHAIKQSSVVLTTILGGKIFTEKHMVRRTIACLCVVLGVLLAII